MGLRTSNFEVKRMKEVLPEANAVIRSLRVDTNGQGVAIIGVHRTRELALDPAVTPFHEEKIYFTSDRNVNDRETVYKKATEPYKTMKPDLETHQMVEVEVKPFFYGWKDDRL